MCSDGAILLQSVQLLRTTIQKLAGNVKSQADLTMKLKVMNVGKRVEKPRR